MFTLLLRDAKIPLAELLVKVVLPSMSTLLLSRTLTPPPEIAELLLKVMFPVIVTLLLCNCRLCSNKRCNNHYQGPTCYGGGAYANGSNLTITGSNTFLDNSASLGGGVSAQNSSNVIISGSTTFSGNSAFDGGGISTQYSSNVNFSGSTTFSCNLAHDYGGGVFALPLRIT